MGLIYLAIATRSTNIGLKITAPNGMGLMVLNLVVKKLGKSQNNCPKWYGANSLRCGLCESIVS